MRKVSPETSPEAIVFVYICEHKSWTAEEQERSLAYYTDVTFPSRKVEIYKESAIYGTRPFLDRPLGHTIFMNHSTRGDFLVAYHPHILYRHHRESTSRILKEKLCLHFVTKRLRRGIKQRRSTYAERERLRHGVPLGWQLYDGKLIPDNIMRAAGQLADMMLKLNTAIPDRADLLDLAYAFRHGFPKGKVPDDGDPRRTSGSIRVRRDIRRDILEYLVDHPNRKTREIAKYYSMNRERATAAISKLRKHKRIVTNEEHKHTITVAGRVYLRSLRERNEAPSFRLSSIWTGSQGQMPTASESIPLQYLQPAEPSLEEQSQQLDSQHIPLTHNSAPEQRPASRRSLKPMRVGRRRRDDPPAARSKTSLVFLPPPDAPDSEPGPSPSETSTPSGDEHAH